MKRKKAIFMTICDGYGRFIGRAEGLTQKLVLLFFYFYNPVK